MASEVVRKVWCDIHLKSKKKKVEANEQQATALHEGKVISIDLCGECYVNLTWQQILSYGTPEDQPKLDKARVSEKIKATGPGKYARALVECSGCHNQYSKGPGWTHHAKWHERNGESVNPIPLAS